MKKINLNNHYLLAILLALASIITSCKEKDDYDYSKIYPIIKKVAGPAAPMQGRHYEVAATIRGGSTYAWTAVNSEVIPIAGIEGAWKTYIYFPDVIPSGEDTAAIISVTETTMGGIVSDPAKFVVETVNPFAALPISGPTLVNGGFSASYSSSPSATDKLFSTYTWESTAGEITPSATEPWKMSISFSNSDVGDVVISLIEETTKGMKDTSYFDVEVNEYCTLENANSDLIGAWSGDDGYDADIFASEVVTLLPTSTGISVTGLNFGWIANYWGETVTDGGTVLLTVDPSGTVVLDYQYCFITDYNGAPYEYWIQGEGRWNNCGPFPTLTINYILTNVTDGYDLPSGYYPDSDVFTATLTMDGGTTKAATSKASDYRNIDLSFKNKYK
jgi:hypothetical protein